MTPEGRKYTANKIEKSDPTQQSALIPSGEILHSIGFNRKDLNVLEDSQGRRFHEIVHSPADQMFLARLLKGIMPVSDVLYDSKSGKYLSYQMPLKDVGESPESMQEFWADSIILAFVFSDRDHWEQFLNNHDGNMLRDGNRYVLFDFDGFKEFNDVLLPPERLRGPNDLSNLHILQDRLGKIRERCAGVSGREFMEAIVHSMNKYGAPTPSVLSSKKNDLAKAILNFQNEVLSRIDAANRIVQEEIDHPSPRGFIASIRRMFAA